MTNKNINYSYNYEPTQIKKIITLVGLPRSGTTVLTAYFDAYERICSIFEPWNANQKLNPDVYLNLKDFLHTFKPDLGKADVLFIKETSTKTQYIESVNYLLNSVDNSIDKFILILLRNPFHIFLSEYQARKEWWGSADLNMSLDLFEEWSRKSLNHLAYIFDLAANHKSSLVIYDQVIQFPEQISHLMTQILPNTNIIDATNFHQQINPKKIRGDLSFTNNPRGFDNSSILKREAQLQEITPIIETSKYYPIWQSYNHLLTSLQGVQELSTSTLNDFCQIINTEISAKTGEDYFNLGQQYQQEKNYDLALQAYQQCVKINPQKWQAFQKMGVIFKDHQKGHWQEAINNFQAAININPNLPHSYNAMGRCFLELNQYKKALEYLEKAIELNFDLAFAHYNLGKALLKIGHLEKAAQEYFIATLLNKDIIKYPDYIASNEKLFEKSENPEKKPAKFIKATHYFVRSSLSNFWNTFHKYAVKKDLENIKNEGFNTIILIVPWANFQPEINPIEYDQIYEERLFYLFEQAKEVGLDVILRVGYVWENDPVELLTFDRYQEFLSDSNIQKAWIDYHKYILRICEKFDNYRFSFLTWEEFYWPLLKVVTRNKNQEQLIDLAKKYGFQEFLEKKYLFHELKELYNLEINSFKEIAIPTPEELLYQEYLLFFDGYIIEQFIATAAIAFRDSKYELHYEHRIDVDAYRIKEGKKEIYQHTRNKYSALDKNIIFWHPPLEGDVQLDTERALSKLKLNLSSYVETTKTIPFLDQFNFYLNNPDFPKSSQIQEEDLGDFVLGAEKIFQEYTTGYGIWGYFDWRDDKVFNGSFELGEKGWQWNNQVKFIQDENNKYWVKLNSNSAINQTLNLKGRKNWFVYLEILVEKDCQLKIEVKPQNSVTIYLPKSNQIQKINQAIFPDQPSTLLHFKLKCVKGEIRIGQIAIYSHVFSNGFRNLYGETRSLIQTIKQLNEKL